MGRSSWPNRDPIGEKGGLNCYSFAINDPCLNYDYLGREPAKGAIVVLKPHTWQNGIDAGESQVDNSVRAYKKDKGWTVFEVESIDDANAKLKGLKGQCVKELNITGHAGGGDEKAVQNIVSKLDPEYETPDYGQLVATYDPARSDFTYSGLSLFKGVNFCKPCTVILRGCEAGKGKAGRALLKRIANLTGCTAKGYDCQTSCQALKSNGGLPGAGYIFAGPNVIEPPDEVRVP